jgi:hypothetical protein
MSVKIEIVLSVATTINALRVDEYGKLAKGLSVAHGKIANGNALFIAMAKEDEVKHVDFLNFAKDRFRLAFSVDSLKGNPDAWAAHRSLSKMFERNCVADPVTGLMIEKPKPVELTGAEKAAEKAAEVAKKAAEKAAAEAANELQKAASETKSLSSLTDAELTALLHQVQAEIALRAQATVAAA